MTLNEIVIQATVYIVSLIHMYWYTKTVFSDGGGLDTDEPNGMWLFLTLCPFVNSLTSFVVWMVIGHPKEGVGITVSKFFNIKK